jgi:hypothetical protein
VRSSRPGVKNGLRRTLTRGGLQRMVRLNRCRRRRVIIRSDGHVARVGPTTPTRAGRLADASVDPTDARLRNVKPTCRGGAGRSESTISHWRRGQVERLVRHAHLIGGAFPRGRSVRRLRSRCDGRARRCRSHIPATKGCHRDRTCRQMATTTPPTARPLPV